MDLVLFANRAIRCAHTCRARSAHIALVGAQGSNLSLVHGGVHIVSSKLCMLQGTSAKAVARLTIIQRVLSQRAFEPLQTCRATERTFQREPVSLSTAYGTEEASVTAKQFALLLTVHHKGVQSVHQVEGEVSARGPQGE